MRLARFLPAAGALGLWVAWIPLDGGYFPRAWYPAAMFVVALATAVALGGRRLVPESRWARAGLGLLAACTAWSFASILWARAQGRAWEESDQTLLYLAMAWLVALVPWRPRSALALLGAWAAAVAVVCAAELIAGLSASDLHRYVLESRWQQPTGYANAAPAIAVMAAWPALAVAAARRVPAPVQVAFTLVAAFLVEFSLLPQSRGALIASVIALPVMLILSPDRLRLLARLAVVGVALVIAGGPIWDVFGQGDAGHPIAPPLHHAANAMLVSLGVAALAAVLALAAERRVHPMPRAAPVIRRALLVAMVVVPRVGVGGGLAEGGRIADYVSDRYAEFKSNDETPDNNPSRIAQNTSDKRYDYWRVSLNALSRAPVGGVGAGGFEREYTEHRRHAKPSQAAHSLWFRSLAETGLVGTALLLLLIAVLGAGLVAACRASREAGAVAAACAAVGTYFAVHVSVDWLELFPALAAPAIALPVIALVAAGPDTRLAAGSGAAAPIEAAGGPWRSRASAAGLCALAAVAIAAVALPYLSLRHVEAALSRPASEAAEADRDLDRAAALEPLSPEPELARGRLELERANFPAAERAFRRALEVEDGWYPHFELALIASRAGHGREARSEIETARRLNPPDPLVQKAAGLIARGKKIDPQRVDRRNIGFHLYNDPRGH